MKAKVFLFLLPLLAASCGLINDDPATFYEFNEMSGRWDLVVSENLAFKAKEAHFVFNGGKNIMNYKYYEDDVMVDHGSFYGRFQTEKTVPVSFGFRSSVKEGGNNVVYAYTEGEQKDFQQSTIFKEYQQAGFTRGLPASNPYNMTNFPFAYGTFLKEGKTLKEFTGKKAHHSAFLGGKTFLASDGESFFRFASSAYEQSDLYDDPYFQFFSKKREPLSGQMTLGDHCDLSYPREGENIYRSAGLYTLYDTYSPHPTEKGAYHTADIWLKNFEYDKSKGEITIGSVEVFDDSEYQDLIDFDANLIDGEYHLIDTLPDWAN
jgi:hypothetical protein